jgi:transcriptional regulator with XRE-family HTH domain
MRAGKLVAWNLRRLRVKRGLSQELLAVDADVDRAYVSRLERGIENPTVQLLERLAKALRAELAEFFRQPSKDERAPSALPGGRRRKSR